jgi:hypothetical protein
VALLAAGTAVPATAAAQACALPADYRSDLRPDPEGTPTIVRIGVMVADVTRIDDVSQSLEGDFIVRKSWTDARLAGAAGCRFQRAEI